MLQNFLPAAGYFDNLIQLSGNLSEEDVSRAVKAPKTAKGTITGIEGNGIDFSR